MIPVSKINDCYTASQVWLRAKLEQDDLALPDYERPLKRLPRMPNFLKCKVAAKAFAAEVYQESYHFLFAI
jgi:hypothetical protein